jgi:hypothetical protein
MKRHFFALLLFSTIFLASGCALFAPKPPLVYRPNAQVETLSAAVSLSVMAGEQGMSANGLMLYQRPDRMRMVVLTPFGTTMMEVVIVGSEITILNPPSGKAFTGRVEDLPPRGDLDAWRQARWVMDADPPGSSLRDGTLERVDREGVKEWVTFENGLVVSKRRANGDEARYNDYVAIDGVALATEIIMESASGKRFRIKVNEPEVNAALDPNAFTPQLDNLALFPLSALKGN